MKKILLTSIFLSLLFISNAHAGVVGNWQYDFAGTNVTLTLSCNGNSCILERNFSDGSKVTENIVKKGHKYISDSNNQYYTITNGDLSIYDNEGFIRTVNAK